MTYYQKNKERLLAAAKARYVAKKLEILEQQKEYKREYYQKHKERLLPLIKARYEKQREARLEYGKTYYQKHRATILERRRAAYAASREDHLHAQAERRQRSLERKAKASSRAAQALWQSKLSPELKATLRLRRIRERKMAAKVFAAGMALTYTDPDHGLEVTMTFEQAKEILFPIKKES